MYIGQSVYVKHENKLKIGIIELIFVEDLEIRLENNTTIRRKFWEIARIKNEED